MKQKNAYISLKDASHISGYSADYIGQLIRNGKLPGKQVFQQVVWMTTEEDVRQYMLTKKSQAGQKSGWTGFPKAGFSSISGKFKRGIEAPRLVTYILYGAATLSICLFLLLFYIFSSSLDDSMNQKAIQNVEATSGV